ncbi:proline--tRNA ligase [Candidatus Peribacteria bacterium RIFCSPHIGHO2_01_FULL_55_13]|nr:MAG: proline--tRNA ligase [Candidatus Peribacteria bacterium RIFCSPHIGHO2_01_FULL_55_13]
MQKITDPAKDFPQWYLDVIDAAGLADHAPVKGCIVFKPYGYALWEAVQRDLDARIKSLGVQNAYFPLLIPESILQREKDHIKGFAPECAVVTHGGGKELAEKLYVRPTSESIIYTMFAKWVQSHRDLPLKLNQWANVVRWEMRTRPFLRTLEFLWQEGHTCHATKEDADRMVTDALQMYVDCDRELLAIPVLTGRKPEHEKFAGALYTLSTEALAKDGKAIQAGTSHNLGQGFSEAYDVSYLDTEGKAQRPWMTSWGLSTRIIGTLIVTHGDAKGLRLPPRIAPIQVVIIPIYKSGPEQEQVLAACRKLKDSFTGIRVHLDDRDEKSPGFKFNEWEVKGVPLRIELGPKDLAKNQAMLARRDTGAKEALPLEALTPAHLQTLLEEIQSSMLAQAQQHMDLHTHHVSTYADLKKHIEGEGGLVWAPWDGELATAQKVQEETKASIRLLGEEPPEAGAMDAVSGKPAKYMAVYAKAY